MAIQLFGDPYNLQGSPQTLQGSSTGSLLQPSSSPSPTVATGTQPVQTTPTYQATQTVTPKVSYADLYYQNVGGNQTVFNRNTQQGYSDPNQLARDLGISTNQIQWNSISGYQQPTPTSTTVNTQTFQPLNQPTYQQTFQTYQPTSSDPNETFARLAAQSGLSLDDYVKLVSGTVSPEERANIDRGLGIPDLYKQLFSPAPSTQELYNNAYKQAGLGDLKAKIDAKLAEINSRQQKYIDKAGTVNENPFLSEASRVGRLRVLDDKKLADIGNLQNEVNALADLYNSGINEVNAVVGRTTADFSNNQQVNALKLQYLQQQAEQQLKDLQATKTKSAYQYLPAYLRAKASSQKPDTIGSNETGFYRWNPDTQTFEQVIAPNVTPNWQSDPFGNLFNSRTGERLGANDSIQGIISAIRSGAITIDKLSPAQVAQIAPYLNQAGPTARQSALSSSLQVVNDLLSNSNLSQISGYLQGKLRLGDLLPSAQLAINQFNQLKGILSLENREKLKGSGAISDFEFKVLSQAATALDRNLPDADFRTQLQNIKDVFEGKYSQTLGGSSSSYDPLGLFSSVGNTSASTGMRTDRHNNPTAFTTDIAKLAGLREGVDYVKGDPFSNGRYYTARLIGDPVATTIRVIDKIGFYTQSGNPRWSYISSIPQANNWNNLNYTQKKQIIAQMYQREGGSSLRQIFA
ncbi:MAG: hypothetical protein VKN72_03915 [Nostocales cyanobacterium 94392]|nr:hypothetical protein [Nostocales cyanobacterium 94392]